MKKILLLFITFIITTSTFAQIDEVQLVVSGIADTKENAITTALRSAIEQAFGTFVSANTEIVNDELTKDKIVTISSGNIKKYEEISSILLPNNQHSVTLNAVVSVKKLTTFAQSHGSSCELAGNVFAENMRLKELNKRNEETALKHLEEQLRILEENLFDISIASGEPKVHEVITDPYSFFFDNTKVDNHSYYSVPIYLTINSTENSNSYLDLYFSTLNSLKLSEQEIEDYERTNLKVYNFHISSIDEYYKDENGNIRLHNPCKDREIYSAKFRSGSIPILKPYKHLEHVFIKINGIEKSENISVEHITHPYIVNNLRNNIEKNPIPNIKWETNPLGFYLNIESTSDALCYGQYTIADEWGNVFNRYSSFDFTKDKFDCSYGSYGNSGKKGNRGIIYKNLSAYKTTDSNIKPKKKSKKKSSSLKNQFITRLKYEVILPAEELSKVTGFEIIYK